MQTRWALAAALAATSLSVPAHAQSASGVTLDELSSVLAEHVSDVKRETKDDASLYFTAKMVGTDGESYGIVVVPHDCTGAVPRCPVVTLYANFTWGTIDQATLEKLVNFNDSNLRGRSYGFGETVGVDCHVFLGDGAGKPYLSARIGEFPGILASFVSHMGE